MAAAAAAASASIRYLLHALPTINNNQSSNLYYLLSFSTPNLFESKPLSLKSAVLTLKPLSSPHLISRFSSSSSSSSFAAYAETDEDSYDDEDGGREYEEEEEDQEGEDFELGKSRAASSSSPTGEEAGRLYVGNLPYSVTSSQLAEIFGQAGTVETAEIVYDRVTDRSRGFAFVAMASSEDAKAAIGMFDGTQVGGRTLKVNFPYVPRGGERDVMGQRTRTDSRGYVDSPYKIAR